MMIKAMFITAMLITAVFFQPAVVITDMTKGSSEKLLQAAHG